MRVGIMQPYFLPYIGYFQLIDAVDLFIVYDNIKYTKKGWINRNRLLLNGTDAVFSLPLKKDSDYLDVVQRELSTDFDRAKLLNQFKGAYSRAPYFSETFPLLENIVGHKDDNLFRFIHNGLLQTCQHLGIKTEIRVSSEIPIAHELKSQDKVLALCKAVGADIYINPIGGMELYAKEDFRENGVELNFIKPQSFEYPQFGSPFIPWLSIVDVMMFNPMDLVHRHIKTDYELI